MGRYLLVDRATGEEIEVDGDTVECLLGVELYYIDWALEQDGAFENKEWKVRLAD